MPAFLQIRKLALDFIKISFTKMQLNFELFLQNKESYEVCNYKKILYLCHNKGTLIDLRKKRSTKKGDKEKKNAERETLELLASGCPECQEIPTARICGVSCLVSGWSRQDVADRLKLR